MQEQQQVPIEVQKEIRAARWMVVWINICLYVACMLIWMSGNEEFIGSVFVQSGLNFFIGLVLIFFPEKLQKEIGKTMLLSSLLVLVIGVPVCIVVALAGSNFH